MSALDHCGIKIYVHLLDLYQEEVPPFPDDWEGKQKHHERAEEFENRLWDIKVPGCEITETCMNHQAWIAAEVDLEDIEDDLERVAQDFRRQIKSLLCEVWG